MLWNYFIIAVRNLRKHKFFSFINITGLSLGVTGALLIALFVIDELKYDRFNAQGDRIYRLTTHINYGGNDFRLATSPAPLADKMRREIPEIEEVTRFRISGDFLVKKDTSNFKEPGAIWADPEVFTIFSIPLLKGNSHTVLTEPNTMVISESAALKYFGGKDPMGQTLILNGDRVYTITGIYKDIPRNSHFHFSMMLAMSGLDESRQNEWLTNNFQTYYLVKKESDHKSIQNKINQILYKYAEPQVRTFTGKSLDELMKSGTVVEEIPLPLLDIHLHSNTMVEFESNGDIRYIYIFSAIALFIIFLAIINFINLSTARSADRVREAGIRKVLGSQRKLLIFQFLTESVIMSLAAVLVGILLAYMMIPYFNSLSGKAIQFPTDDIVFWIIIVLSGATIGLVSGIYPAIMLSSLRPVTTLTGKKATPGRSRRIRSALVVFQFTISIVLLTATFAVYNQMQFIRHFKPGYNKNQVITVNVSGISDKQSAIFKSEVLKDSAIESATLSGYLPGSNSTRTSATYWKKGNRSPEASVNMQAWAVDHDYIKTLGMNIIAGRDFSTDFADDSSAIILNERAAKLFNFKNPIGEEIQVFGSMPDNSMDEGKIITMHIIGIVQDFNWESLHDSIGSLSLYLDKSNDKISFFIRSFQTQSALKSIEEQWRKVNPGYPFEYSFLGEDIARMYTADSRTGKIVTAFAILALIIACLGLFALASFLTVQRSAEIAVRKVMGATERDIIFLLSRNFTVLVLLAFLLSVPIAWIGISLWLESFAYKSNMGIHMFFIVGIMVFIISCLTVAYQSYRAASANPAITLRSE
jgi:putative ABC transport system permease protein